MSGSVSSSAGRSAVSSSGRMPGRSRDASRTPTPVTTRRAPTRAARSSACSSSSRTTWAPTVPPPSTTTDSCSGGGAMAELLAGRDRPPPECAAGRVHDSSWRDGPTDAPMSARRPASSPGGGSSATVVRLRTVRRPARRRGRTGRPRSPGAARSGRRRRARTTTGGRAHQVVVRGHRPAVGARGRDRQQVAAREVGGQPGVADHDVAGLAVLADHAGQHRRGRRTPGRPARRCSRRRRGPCGCCRSSRRRPRRRCARRPSGTRRA